MIYTITVVPYLIAFTNSDSTTWVVIDLIMDSLFMMDVIINCFCAYFKNEEELEISHKQIIINYASSWMVFDILASIPFQLILANANWKGLVRFGKLPRLYRLVKIAKIVKIIKTQINVSQISEIFGCQFRIPLGIKRLFSFLVVFFVLCHLIACLWFFTASLQPNTYYNWVTKYGYQDKPDQELYIASLYWTVTTLSTVGYGDITPANSVERGVCILVMLGGVFFYSYTIGTITSLMADLDKKKSKFNNKLLILQEINKNYNIGKKLMKKIKSALEYDQSRFNKETSEMIMILPKKLALQLNLLMNKKLVEQNNKFFENRPLNFIDMVLSCLRPLKLKAKDHVFDKDEYSVELYFVTSGELVCFDILSSDEINFDVLTEGDYFGDIGVIMNEPYEFGVKTVRDSELMALTRDDLFSKVLTGFDEKLRADIILKTTQRRDIARKKRDQAISEFVRTKTLVRAITKEVIKNDSADASFSTTNSKKINDKRIRKIRNTLSPKAITMLESTNTNELEKIKREFDGLKLLIEIFQEKIKMKK